jgi:Tol biopolymer transport system component
MGGSRADSSWRSHSRRETTGKELMRKLMIGLTALTAAGALWLAGSGPAAATRHQGNISLVSISDSGALGNGPSQGSAISANGRYVAFTSSASNLVAGDTNGVTNVFVRDLYTNTTTLVSAAMGGAAANGASLQPSISANGRYVAFTSSASNLVAGDTNSAAEVFVRDLYTKTTTLLSVGMGGAAANGVSLQPSISANGRYVAFTSAASNLVPGDTNNATDVFVRSLGWHPKTTRASVSTDGSQGNGDSLQPSLSADGSTVAFTSEASNLVPGDTNNATDVFVRSLGWHPKTTRISVSTDGSQGNGDSAAPELSWFGQAATFTSDSSNLVSGDTNDSADIFVWTR